MRVRGALLLSLVTVAAALALAGPGLAEESDAALFQGGVAALARGALDDAIDRFELLADRGVVHPDLSFDRGIAYARRGGSRSAHPGDLGRASAALHEVLLSRPDDDDAQRALERVQHEVARRRARVGAPQMDLRPSFGRAVVGLLAENTWATLAAVSSLVLSLGLALRLFVNTHRVQLGGTVAASLAALSLVVSGSFAALARRERLTLRPAVVIVEEARLQDENGASITGPGTVLPEGAPVLVVDQRGTRAHVEWGTLDGWLSLGQLRLLARP